VDEVPETPQPPTMTTVTRDRQDKKPGKSLEWSLRTAIPPIPFVE
jgi:hypothetical protein